MEAMTVRRIAAFVLTLAIAGASGCSGHIDGGGSGCPEGTSERSSTNEVAGPGAPTREAAIRVELEQIGMDASDDAIASGVIAGGPGGNTGSEAIEIRTDDGTMVTMTLTALDPGWAVVSSRWCAPNSH